MIKTFTLLFASLFAYAAHAQTIPTAQAFGKIDIADLEMKSCDFEKDANAEVLFDKANIYYNHNLELAMDRHKRIKIFNDKGKDKANIRIQYFSGNRSEYITGVQAQTINIVDGKPEITKLDKKLIYTERIDKLHSALVFTMPNVKAGSVVEYKYLWNTNSLANFPDWYFQDRIPVRYSELTTMIPDMMYFKIKSNLQQPIVVSKSSAESRSTASGADGIAYQLDILTRGVANIHSLPDEPYMTSTSDNLQSIVHYLTRIAPLGTFTRSYSDTWAKVGGMLADDEDFGVQLKRKLLGEEALVAKAKTLKGDEAKIEFLFNEVKNTMKWNGVDSYQTDEGTAKAWEKKTGNSAEVNLILYHLIKQAGIEVYPMIVSTRDHGKVTRWYTFLYQFNRAVAYAHLDDGRYMVLDATGKYNSYNETPDELLNGDGLYIDKQKKVYDIVYLTNGMPVRQVVMINADIKNDGKMAGTAQINSFGYHRINSIKNYKTDGEKKYTDNLRDNNNNLRVSSLKFENMDVDTLPLVQNVNFNLDLTGSDENYIYFTPNLFSSLRSNPFLSENRFTDIEFGHRNNYSIVGLFKIPANYKADALPKSVSMMMPDSSITFRRMVAHDAEQISVRFVIDYKKTNYPKENYPDFYDFCKKMYEMLNEQIVLKKS